MQMIGELIVDKIIVKKPKDASRLYNKSRFGKMLTGNKLQMDLLEGVFLLGEGKITVFHNDKEIDFQKLVKIAAEHIPRFEIKYLIFRDLRKRGYPVKLSDGDKDIDFCIDKQKKNERFIERSCFISAYSERDVIDIDDIKRIIETAVKNEGELWFAIVDEEGDLTYYDVAVADVMGKTREHVFSKTTGVLLENRIVIYDKELAEGLLEKEFFGKPFGDGLQLSLVEALYLLEKNVIDIEDIKDGRKLSKREFKTFVKRLQPDIGLRIMVFSDLKQRGLIVKTGFKFGAHFRAYTKKPGDTHAEYLVHVVDKGFKSIWSEISRAVRLAHSVNKEIIFARVDGKAIDYIKLGRLRP